MVYRFNSKAISLLALLALAPGCLFLASNSAGAQEAAINAPVPAAIKTAPPGAGVNPDPATGDLPADNKVLRIGDHAPLPKSLVLTKPGSSLFVFNDTAEKDLNLEIEFGQKPGFCATGAMKMGADGVFRTRKPVQPGHFVVVCFAHAGRYPFVARSAPDGAAGGKLLAKSEIKVGEFEEGDAER